MSGPFRFPTDVPPFDNLHLVSFIGQPFTEFHNSAGRRGYADRGALHPKRVRVASELAMALVIGSGQGTSTMYSSRGN